MRVMGLGDRRRYITLQIYSIFETNGAIDNQSINQTNSGTLNITKAISLNTTKGNLTHPLSNSDEIRSDSHHASLPCCTTNNQRAGCVEESPVLFRLNAVRLSFIDLSKYRRGQLEGRSCKGARGGGEGPRKKALKRRLGRNNIITIIIIIYEEH